MRHCKRCGKEIGRMKQLCPECRKMSDKETRERCEAKKRYKRIMNHEYKYNKYHGLEKKKSKKYTSDLTKELDRLGLKYRDAQLMAQNGTLPEDFGLGCVLR